MLLVLQPLQTQLVENYMIMQRGRSALQLLKYTDIHKQKKKDKKPIPIIENYNDLTFFL